jgi:hypothetical protein
MGGQGKSLITFSNGDYTGATNTEDDFAVMGTHGISVRADDHGSASAAADGVQRGVTTAGVIETRTDRDVFAVHVPCDAGTITATEHGAQPSGDLDAQLRLLEPNGGVVASDNPPSGPQPDPYHPATGLDAAITTGPLTTGVYYAELDGVGEGDATTGYSDYGSRGQYAFSYTVGGCDPGAADVPSAPTQPAATPAANGTSVDLAWEGPASNGGAAVSGYTVRVLGAGAQSLTGTATTIGGLTPATSYRAWIVATNNVGDGPQAEVTFRTPRAPDPPTGLTAQIGATWSTAHLTWIPPGSDGGSPLTGYVVQVAGGAAYAIGNVTSYDVTGLAKHTTYSFTVRATNAVGSGTPSTAAGATTPDSPTQPAGAQVDGATDTSVTLSWNDPWSDGGRPVTGFVIAVDGADQPQLPATQHGLTLLGLSPGTSYAVTVRAVNEVGLGLAFNVPALTTGGVPPQSPTGLGVTPGQHSLKLTWTPPTESGTTPIAGYTLSLGGLPVADLPASATTYTFTGLRSGTAYTVSVAAHNDSDASSPAAISAKTLASAPSAPRIGTAVSGAKGGAITAKATWSAPASTGGSAVTSYRVTALRVSSTGVVVGRKTVKVGASKRALVMTLTKGSYRFAVVAVNAIGASKASARSNRVSAR